MTQIKDISQFAALLLAFTFAGTMTALAESPFNGKDLSNWEVKGKKNDSVASHWKVENDMIVGENPKKKGSILWTKAEYGNYELTLEFKTPSKDYDSGVYVRGSSHQVQIGVSRSLKKDLTGAIYCPKDKVKVNGKSMKYPLQPDQIIKKTHELNEWNKMKIIAKGAQITVIMNDTQIVDYTAKTLKDKGPIGLQLHANVHMKMLFRNIEIKETE